MHVVGNRRDVVRLEHEIQKHMGRVRVGGIRGNRHLVKPDERSFTERIVGNLDPVPGFGSPVASAQNVSRPAHRHADLAVRQSSDIAGGVEFPNVLAHRIQRAFGPLEGFGRVRDLPGIFHGRRYHLARRIEEVDAAGGEFLHVGGIEHQREQIIGASSPRTSTTLSTLTPTPVVPQR